MLLLLKHKMQQIMATRQQSITAVYNITIQLCGKMSSRNVAIESREGVLSSDNEQEEKWIEHFKGVLNRPGPTSQAVFSGDDRKMINIETGPFTLSELNDAIKKLKRTRQAGKTKL